MGFHNFPRSETHTHTHDALGYALVQQTEHCVGDCQSIRCTEYTSLHAPAGHTFSQHNVMSVCAQLIHTFTVKK